MKPQRQPTRPSDGPPPRKRIKGGTITIPLPSRPKDYIPGSGPPLQPVELLPPSDSTAYIVERILLPPAGLAKDGKPLPKRMAYIVGWRDLPAARLLVPVMEILDYVSPFALEEWEYNMELELEQDRARLEEERRELQQHPAKAASKAKARPPVHSEIEAAAVAEAESDGQAKGRMKKGVMSLSTPQKTKMEAFADLSDGYDGYESPSEQIARETAKMDVDESSESTSTSEPEAQIESQGGAQLSEVRASGSKAATSSEPPTVTVRDLASNAEPRQTHPFFKSTNNNKSARTQGAIVPVRATSAPTNDLVAVRRRDVPIPVPINHKKRPLAPRQQAVKREATDTPSTGDDDWEVERIEGTELFEVEGEGLTRYFKVRWAGDWPADQNPTWEPEENLPTKLVRGYMKTPQKRQKTSNVEVSMTHTPKAVKGWVQSTRSWPPANTATFAGGAAAVEDGDESSSKESSSRGDSDEEASSGLKPEKEVSSEQNSSDEDSSEGESNDDSSSDEDSSQSGGSESAG
ncbi:hypothetical protein K4F52_001588 [Lecanicillium sp. MT-2017a]|nr:hypothetical protein K4F52_001588 [Lecanicillium sp. MT-2017a]